MNQAKYIGMDVHQKTISVAVMGSAGKLILESILETNYLSHLEIRGAKRISQHLSGQSISVHSRGAASDYPTRGKSHRQCPAMREG